jgi:hypothetical protein
VVFYFGNMAFLIVSFLVVLPLLRRFLERRYNVKIESGGYPPMWTVRGGTPTQRFAIPLLMLVYILVVFGVAFLAFWLYVLRSNG